MGKFCKYCGAQNTDGAEYCGSCGKQLEIDGKGGDVERNLLGSKKLLAIMAGIVVVVIIFIAYIALHKKTINLRDYTNVVFEGYNGYGEAYIDFDDEKFAKDIMKATGMKQKSLSDVNGLDDLVDGIVQYGSQSSEIDEIDGAYEYDLEPSENLSNGDKVTVTYKYDNSAIAKYKIKFVGKSFEEEVSGLSEANEVDPFSEFHVSFDGISPHVSVEGNIASDDEMYDNVEYKIKQEEDLDYGEELNLKIGDTVTFVLEYDKEQIMSDYGVVFSQTEKDYKVENVQAYLENVSEVSEDLLSELKNVSEDYVDAYLAGEKDDDVDYNDLNYEGYYFLVEKEYDDNSAYNVIYVVYSAMLDSSDGGKKKKMYFPVRFINIYMDESGEVVGGIEDKEIEASSVYVDADWGWIDGYEKESEMKNDLVTARKGNYNTEVIGLK